MKKENITLDSSTKKFNELSEKAILLKEKIEQEINEINKLYEKVNTELTKSYEIKHEKLILEENNLREKLQNEVTKVKEQLEKFLSESNKVIKYNEKIGKGIKMLQKDEEKNMIKTLSYVSKINKAQKEMMTLNKELIKNLKITFQEEKNEIKFEYYYFNGIQIPKEIEFKEVNINNFKIFWKIDDINIINVDNKQIKYRVEIKKENDKDKFIKVYEGNNNNCLVDKLDMNTNYEVRICCFYNDLVGFWTKNQKVKTSDFDSCILNESNRKNEFLQKIFEWSGCSKMELLYRGTRDGSKSDIFHNKCDNQGPTLCLYKNEKGHIFGGYSSISWTSDNQGYKSAPGSFIFTLSNIHGTEPTKFPNINTSYSVYHYSSRGPSFGYGCEIYIYEDFINTNSYSNFPNAYQDVLNKGKSVFTGDLNNSNYYFKVKDIEVFKIFN